MAELRYGKALGQALRDAMGADPAVILFGEDVAAAGGPFGVTRGLLDAYGPDRVRDTPISEAALAGVAVGAAMGGLKPVLEIMFMDFVTLTMDALVNQAAKARFMFGGQGSVPMVVRMPHGGGLSAGPQHSQCLEAWLAHVPGLKVAAPSNPTDAYGLLRAAIDDPDPVILVEHKAMYGAKGPFPESPESVPLGRARTVREGHDLTLVAYGAAVGWCEGAAERLAQEGVSAEVIDLRTIQPWDEAAVLQSLEKTHRLVVAHEAVTPFGVGAEIAARMADAGFDELDAPIARVGAAFMPVPYAPELERAQRPGVDDVMAAARKVLA